AGVLKTLGDAGVFASVRAAEVGSLTQIGAVVTRDWSDRLATGGDKADIDAKFEEMAAAWSANLPERAEQLTRITRNDELLTYGVAYCGLNWPPRTHEGTQALGLIVWYTLFVAAVMGLIAVPTVTGCVIAAGTAAYAGREMTIKWSERARVQLDSSSSNEATRNDSGGKDE
ncbi:hypothetical protein, partial [Arthrobacter tumbae]